MTPRRFTIFLSVFGCVCVCMLLYIVIRNRETRTIPVTTISEDDVTDRPAPQSPTRSFATIERVSGNAQPGGTWTAEILAPTWAACVVDMYQPQDRLFPQGKDAARAVAVAPGVFRWTWSIPSNAQRGTWTARVLCGTADNLAGTDYAIEIK